jgi:hypothetical protein
MASWARCDGKEHGNDAESTTLMLLLDVLPTMLLGIVRESA